MKLSFYGASGEVTGSNYVLETSRSKIVIDCGAFQGGKEQELKNMAPFLYDAAAMDALILTHAHLDHVGRLAKLVKAGFTGPIWSTPATKELAELIMLDASSIMSHEELKFGDIPIYNEQDVYNTLRQFKTIDYDVKTEIADGVTIRLVDAGHILGSASVELWADGQKIVFSGDIGNVGAPIIEDPTKLSEADYIICESTYGGRTHEAKEQRQALLQSIVQNSIEQKGILLIPAFALERSQELLFDLHQMLTSDMIPSVPIFLDSPLAAKATEVFSRFPEYYDKEATELVKAGINFFDLPGLELTASVEQSKHIREVAPPKIIIAGSGMMTGGRIKFHLHDYLADPKTTLFIVGYQAEGTLGRRLLDGVKHVDLRGEKIPVNARVVACGAFSAHADHPQFMGWIKSIK
jgi:metallo-beta-lactamase family protein